MADAEGSLVVQHLPSLDEPIPDSDGRPREREREVDAAVDRIVTSGAPRLHRTWPQMISTGTVAGFEVSLGVLAMLYVERATGSVILGGLAFSVGFIALLLGRSELFTEGFLTPVAVLAAKRANLSDAVRLWVGTFAGNLLGGFVIAWVAMHAYPSLYPRAVKSAQFFVKDGWTLRTFCLAVLAGAAITLMTRMHNGTEDAAAQVIASIATAFLIAGLRLFHSVLDSLVIFFALEGGRAPFGYEQWLRFLSVALVGNVLGGFMLTTLLRLVRSRQRLAEHRMAVEQAMTEGVNGPRRGTAPG